MATTKRTTRIENREAKRALAVRLGRQGFHVESSRMLREIEQDERTDARRARLGKS